MDEQVGRNHSLGAASGVASAVVSAVTDPTLQSERDHLGRARAELAQIDSVIRMFTPNCHPDMIPSIRPAGRRDMFFSYRELPRMCLDILRNAEKPLRLDHIAVQIGMLKGLDIDGPLRRHVTNGARATLVRMEARERTRGPSACWWTGYERE